MAFNKAPSAFFGPLFTIASHILGLPSSEDTGTLVGTTFACTTADTLTFASDHGLIVGDRIRLTQVTTLPTGVSAATDYWVKSAPTATTITLSASKNHKSAAVVAITVSGSADNTAKAHGLVDEVTDAEAHVTTGDWRKVVFGIMEMLHAKYDAIVAADRPTRLSITKSTYQDAASGTYINTYTVTIKTNAAAVEVADE